MEASMFTGNGDTDRLVRASIELEKQNEKMVKEISDFRSEIAELRKEIAGSRSEVNALRNEVLRLTADNSGVHSAFKSYQANVERAFRSAGFDFHKAVLSATAGKRA